MSVRARDPDRAHCPHHRETLFERQTESRVNDKKSNETGEQSESGEVQMKAVREPADVARLLARREKAERVAGDHRERRRTAPGLFLEDKSGNLLLPIKHGLRKRRYRQPEPPAAPRQAASIGGSVLPPSSTIAAPSAADSSRKVSGVTIIRPGGLRKSPSAPSPAIAAIPASRGRVSRLYADQPEGFAVDPNRPFEHWRDLPARQPQV